MTVSLYEAGQGPEQIIQAFPHLPPFHVDRALYFHAEGIDVISTQTAGRLGTSDDDQIACAAAQKRVLVTFNIRHFPLTNTIPVFCWAKTAILNILTKSPAH